MSAQQLPWRRARSAWLSFWFGAPAPHAMLALIRIGTGLILLYVLFMRSFDLASRFTAAGAVPPEALQAVDPVAWRFSVFTWVDSAVWLWSMHVLAILAAATLLLGVATPLAALASLFFVLSYVHHNPLMVLGIDGLLTVALAYLALASSGRVLSAIPRHDAGRPLRISYDPERVWEPPAVAAAWASFPVRLLQVHLCLIYLRSGLAKLGTDWLAGLAFWHPRLLQRGSPLGLEALLAEPWLTSVLTYGLVLFQVLYGVLIWLPRLRYAVLGAAVVAHLGVGLAWGLLPFNLLMLVLNLAFVPREHLEALVERVAPLLTLPWMTGED